MRIQYLNGGLANQTFQYIFARYAQLKNPDEEQFFLDDSFFYVNNVHNGLELEKVFDIKLNLLSRAFDSDVWDAFIENKRNGISVPQTLKNLGFPIYMLSEFENYKEHNPFDGEIFSIQGNTFHPEITKLPGENVYYHGYWLNPNWFTSYKSIFKEELRFKDIEDDVNKGREERIKKAHSAAVHVRRGDYVTLGWDTDPSYYKRTLKELLEKHDDLKIFVFSDDYEWCREHSEELGLPMERTEFIHGNVHGKNYIDLQLMSMCNIIVAGKSAFSYLAVLLNDDLEQYIYE